MGMNNLGSMLGDKMPKFPKLGFALVGGFLVFVPFVLCPINVPLMPFGLGVMFGNLLFKFGNLPQKLLARLCRGLRCGDVLLSFEETSTKFNNTVSEVHQLSTRQMGLSTLAPLDVGL